MLNQEDLFTKLNFSEVQIDALRQIYAKYFEQHIPAEFDGRTFIAVWKKGYKYVSGTKEDAEHGNPGISVDECDDDVLWQNFADLLPHMVKFATIPSLPPGSRMWPHIDRKNRPASTIYFPIKGCTEDCPSYFYDLPKIETNAAQSNYSNPTPIYKFAITDNAVLVNVHEWHNVTNNSQVRRVVFGLNMLPEYSYAQAKDILSSLGYLK